MSDMKILTGEDATVFEPWTFPEVKTPRALKIDEQQRQTSALLHEQKMRESEEEAKRTAAIEQGYQEGLVRGKEEAAAEIQAHYEPLWQEKLQLFEQLLQQLTVPLSTVDAELEHLLCELVKKLTRHLLQDELTIAPHKIIKLVQNSLELLPIAKKNLCIYVNPLDIEILKGALSAEYSACLTEDAHLQRGECRINSDNSVLDASFDTRLAKLCAEVFHEGK